MNNTITMVQNRELRENIRIMTQSCMLTQEEYAAIMKVLLAAAERLERE